MSLLIKLNNGDTLLKSLKFGKDRPGGGDSGQPYIQTSIEGQAENTAIDGDGIIIAHNLNRELQMIAYEKVRNTTEKRSSLWIFQELNTIRKNIIQRAGRLTKPQGKLKLTMNANENIQGEILHFFDALATPR